MKRPVTVEETPTQDQMLQAFPAFVHACGEFSPENLMGDLPYAEFMPNHTEEDFSDGDVVAIYKRVEVYRVKKTVVVEKTQIKLGGGK